MTLNMSMLLKLFASTVTFLYLNILKINALDVDSFSDFQIGNMLTLILWND